MAVTTQDLVAFNRFAEREIRDVVKSIERSEADIEAGRVHPASEVFAEVRKMLGLPAR